jgi:hypothetical protein
MSTLINTFIYTCTYTYNEQLFPTGTLMDEIPAVGHHEVIIETPTHNAPTALRPLKDVENLVLAWKERGLVSANNTDIRQVCLTSCIYVPMYLYIYVYMYLCGYESMYLCIYIFLYLCIYVFRYLCIYVSVHANLAIIPVCELQVLYFKNQGALAGASLVHPHSQLIGLPVSSLCILSIWQPINYLKFIDWSTKHSINQSLFLSIPPSTYQCIHPFIHQSMNLASN